MDVEGIDVLQRVPESDPYPITPKEHGIDFLMNHRHLWLRSSRQVAILRIRDTLIHTIGLFFRERGYVRVDTPILSPGAAEGALERPGGLGAAGKPVIV